MLKNTGLPLVALMDTEQHLHRRRNWQRGMSPSALKGYEALVARRARLLLRRLEEQKGAPVAMGEWFNFFTYVRAGGHLYGRGGGVLVASQLC